MIPIEQYKGLYNNRTLRGVEARLFEPTRRIIMAGPEEYMYINEALERSIESKKESRIMLFAQSAAAHKGKAQQEMDLSGYIAVLNHWAKK